VPPAPGGGGGPPPPRPGEPRLVAYLVLAEGRGPGDGIIRRALAAALPAEMIPSAFVRLPSMPLLEGGKIDRHALPAPPPDRPVLDTPFIPPRTPLEQVVAAIWSEVLQLDAVGVQDDFLELGGNSLLAAQIVTRLTDRLGFSLPQGTALDAPTVEQMVVAILAEGSFPSEAR
jgi:nonribosomal peptide synthetase DhbF